MSNTVTPEAMAAMETKYLTLHEFVKAAKNRLDANLWDYLVGATETETTMRRNRMGIDSLAVVLVFGAALFVLSQFVGR